MKKLQTHFPTSFDFRFAFSKARNFCDNRRFPPRNHLAYIATRILWEGTLEMEGMLQMTSNEGERKPPALFSRIGTGSPFTGKEYDGKLLCVLDSCNGREPKRLLASRRQIWWHVGALTPSNMIFSSGREVMPAAKSKILSKFREWCIALKQMAVPRHRNKETFADGQTSGPYSRYIYLACRMAKSPWRFKPSLIVDSRHWKIQFADDPTDRRKRSYDLLFVGVKCFTSSERDNHSPHLWSLWPLY